MKPYFVMLNCADEEAVITLLDSVGKVAQFNTELEARSAGKENMLGKIYGFEIFELGSSGVDYIL